MLTMVGWMVWLAGLCFAGLTSASNITDIVFGADTDIFPAAFADLDADELTDVVVLSRNGSVVSVLLAHATEPLLRAESAMQCSFPGRRITSVVPGDFDGDAHMDLLVTTIASGTGNVTLAHILWGSGRQLNCTQDVWAEMWGHPLALDYDRDNIVDLFGVSPSGVRTLWLSRPDRTHEQHPFSDSSNKMAAIRRPHSHAFLDIDGDSAPDLLLSTEDGFELHLGFPDTVGFKLNTSIDNPHAAVIGQSAFVDLDQSGQLEHVLPVCADTACNNSTLMVYSEGSWRDLRPILTDASGHVWGWPPPDGKAYTDTITLRLGDFNMDGFCDLLATLQLPGGDQRQPFLLENVACATAGCTGRSFALRAELQTQAGGKTLAAFYDVHQDGVLDVIMAGDRASAFRNNLDYDANFVKVMVGGRQGNLPGPRIAYRTTTVEGTPVACVAAQLPQSAHFSLALPYVVFGLGRTPNFVDTLRVGVAGRSRDWSQIIPNSQVQVFWTPRWRVRLFVAPSRLVLGSLLALGATCLLIGAVVLVLHLAERRADRREKQAQAHRFHFDAM